MKVIRIAVLLSSVFILPADCCYAGSIWAKRGADSKSVYADDKAVQIGDTLTVIINEDSKVDNKVKRDLEKSTSTELGISGSDIKVEHVLPSVPSVNLNTSSSKSLAGKADYKDQRSIEDRITVIVEDIHPNGNLVVIGTRSRDIAGDKQTIQASGIVRPSDISFDNTIRSEQIANFQLVTISDGVSGSYNNPGWLARILDFIWPF